MCGATRTCSFDRPRYGSTVHLSETHAVDADDSKKVVFCVEEHNPRRGFSIRVKITLRAHRETSCDATIVAECRPVGKDMSNQAAVHKAFLLVLDELKARYGTESGGLLACFMNVVDQMDARKTERDEGSSDSRKSDKLPRLFHRTDPQSEEKKYPDKESASSSPSRRKKRSSRSTKSGLVSFEDMLKTGRKSPDVDRPPTPSLINPPEMDLHSGRSTNTKSILTDEFDDEEMKVPGGHGSDEPRVIEIKPLPKIRLSLMPSPREEDEDELSGSSSPQVELKNKLSSKSSKSKKKKSLSFRTSTSKKVSRQSKSSIT